MTIQAFKSRRVTEALKAIDAYLDLAVDLAGEIKPSETLRLELESSSVAPDVRLTDVLWDGKSNVIDVTKIVNPQKVQVIGDHLTHLAGDKKTWQSNVTVLKLIGHNTEGVFFEATKFENPFDHGFDAELKLVGGDKPQLGRYDALAVDVTGRTSVLSHACSIEKDEVGSVTVPTADYLELGAMLPDSLPEATTVKVTLIVLKGDPRSFWIGTLTGESAKGFSVKMIDDKPTNYGRILTLEVKVPSNTAGHAFWLVAKSADQSEQRVVFSVVSRGSGQASAT